MKNQLSTIVLALICSSAFSQTNTFPSSGNVGIGTLSPIEKLHIVDEGLFRPTFEAVSSENYIRPILDFSRSRGNISTKVAVVDQDKLGSIYFRGYDGSRYVESSAIGSFAEGTVQTDILKGVLYFSTNDGSDLVYNVPKMRMAILSSGNVLINPKLDALGNLVANYPDGEGKLQVRGLIRAQSIKVETTNWPDYVFLPSYKIPSLQEVEAYIKAKGHLPGIPSADEVKANGVDLGEMNVKLLQKIEELTIYLIEQEKKFTKQIQLQQEQIDQLSKKK